MEGQNPYIAYSSNISKYNNIIFTYNYSIGYANIGLNLMNMLTDTSRKLISCTGLSDSACRVANAAVLPDFSVVLSIFHQICLKLACISIPFT